MTETLTFDAATQGVIEMAHYAGARGLVPATSGNFSVRMDGGRAALTATGSDKAKLTPAGVIEVEIAGPAHPRASAEAPLHLARYAADEGIGAIAHVHGMAASVLSRRYLDDGYLRLEGWELQKAFAGVKTHEARIDIPIVANDQDTERLAALVEGLLGAREPVPGYLIAGHGLYVWGCDVAETLRHLEAFEFLLTAQLQLENMS